RCRRQRAQRIGTVDGGKIDAEFAEPPAIVGVGGGGRAERAPQSLVTNGIEAGVHMAGAERLFFLAALGYGSLLFESRQPCRSSFAGANLSPASRLFAKGDPRR